MLKRWIDEAIQEAFSSFNNVWCGGVYTTSGMAVNFYSGGLTNPYIVENGEIVLE